MIFISSPVPMSSGQGNATGATGDDIDGDIRPSGAAYDMGADEYLL